MTLTLINIISILCVLISYYLWYEYGKDRKLKKKKVTSLPPLSISTISLIYNGKVTKEDLLLLLLSLTNKGYIKIEEENTNKYKLTKLKDYDEKDEIEELFMRELFTKTDSITMDEYLDVLSNKKEIKNKKRDTIKTIKPNELLEKFHFTSKRLLPILNNGRISSRYHEQNSNKKRIYLLIMISIILLLTTCYPFYELNKIAYIPVAVLFSILTLVVVTTFVNKIDLEYITSTQIAICTFLIIAVWLVFLLPGFSYNNNYVLTYFIGAFSILLILVLYRYMPRRTKLGTELMSQIDSYKDYIINQTEDDIKKELSKNKYYLQELLPYSYILGINDIILKRIKNNDITPKNFILKEDYTITKYINSIKRLRDYLMKY